MRLSFWGRVTVGMVAVFMCVPAGVVVAAEASPEAILRAVAGARAAGLCAEQAQQVSPDCLKTTVRCEGGADGGWGAYVNRYFEQVGHTVQTKQLSRSTFQTTERSSDPVPTDALDYLRADWQRNSVTPPGPIQKGTCYCACGANETDDVCRGKEEGFPVLSGDSLTYEECASQCGSRAVVADKCRVQPLATNERASVAAAKSFDDDAFCFTPSECARQNGFFEAHPDCRERGRCYAAEPTIRLQVPIGGVTEVRGLSRYIVAVYRYGISVIAVVATILFVYGAFLYLVGSALPSIDRGRTIMREAILGMIFVLAATAILRTINPATTQINPLKVYMVNNRQFVNVAQCSDLGPRVRVAPAGQRPGLIPYATVAANEGAFKIPATNADCGQTYWVENTAEASCEGTRCPDPREACVSCSDPSTPGCNGVANDRQVCARTIFAGTIDYVDGRYPTNVELLGACNYAQNTEDVDVVEDNLFSVARQGPDRVGRRTQSQTTDENASGRSSYLLNFTEEDIQEAVDDCADQGGFRGALLGLVYEEPFGINDVALLSPVNCRASQFNGYANGTDALDAVLNITPFAEALMCGVRNGNFLDSPGQYWTKDQLLDAVRGKQSIVCNVTLSDETAPDDPADAFCSR